MKLLFSRSISLFLLLVLAYPACNKKALNVPPPTPTEDSYFSTETEFRTAVVGVYASLTDYYSSSNVAGGSGSAVSESFLLPGDDLTTNSSEDYEIFSGLSPADAKLNQIFVSSYILIGRANTVLQKLRDVKAGVFTTPNLQNINIGEMLFLRAFAHFTLWNLFGTAPVDTIRVVSTSQLNPPSSKGTALLDQSIADLTQAASLLSTTPWDAANTGRVTANSAYGLLGKCLVFRATVNKSSADYTAAIAAFTKINGVDLVSNFEDNFDVSKENNTESLFEFQAGVPIVGSGTTNYWLANDAVNIGVASAYYGSFGVGNNQYMGGGLYIATDKLTGIYDPADPRLPLTLTVANGQINKYILNDKTEGCCGVTSVNNTRILRYADVLLLQAEATLQSGGSASSAIALINRVRARARNMVGGGTVPADLDITVTDKTMIMQWIMDERLRELAAEGQRWFDLRRWAIAGIISLDNAFFSSTVSSKMGFDNHYLYFPIPTSETDKNPNITQNPGY
jgi:hypothetical protein